MKLVHAYLKHAENKRISKNQFPSLFPYIYIFCSGLCYSMIPCLFLPALCFLVWLQAPVLLLQPCFSHLYFYTNHRKLLHILLNNKCCHKNSTTLLQTVAPSPSVHLHVSELLYWNIIKNWHNRTLVFWTQLQLAVAQHARLQKESRGARSVEAPQRLLCVKEQPDCSF